MFMRDLMNDLLVERYSVAVEQIGYVIIRIDKRGVPMSLNDKKEGLKLSETTK